MDYQQKYLKYKQKYLTAKQLYGGHGLTPEIRKMQGNYRIERAAQEKLTKINELLQNDTEQLKKFNELFMAKIKRDDY